MAQPARRFAFVLARDLGCTVKELGRRMSAQEFGEWQVMFEREQLSPVTARVRHAQVLAAQYQGASNRKDGQPWDASQFLPADRWCPPAAPVRQVSVLDQVRALNKRRARKH